MKPSEVWLPMPSYKHYIISNKGRILSLQPNKKPSIIDILEDQFGNLTVQLIKEEMSYTYNVNHLIGEAFELSWI